MKFKDYYESLGVSRTATADEIRKAFRKLAREFHPDVAKNKAVAEEKFKEINEAYEVLGDPDKRKKYDELGADWKHGADFRPPGGGRTANFRRGQPQPDGGAEFHFGGTGFSDFFEQLFGQRRNGGEGFRQWPGPEESAQRGQDVEADLMVTLEEAFNGSVRTISFQRTVPCLNCGGLGEVRGKVCHSCGGAGYTQKTEEHKVKVPVGVREGQLLRLAGHGEPGSANGPAGDLFLRVRYAKHPNFRVEQDHLYYDLDLAPWEIVLGANVSIPTMAGNVSIKIPPGTQNGQTLRVRGKGLPIRGGGQGDLFVVVNLQVPSKISDTERALWEKLAKESSFKPRE